MKTQEIKKIYVIKNKEIEATTLEEAKEIYSAKFENKNSFEETRDELREKITNYLEKKVEEFEKYKFKYKDQVSDFIDISTLVSEDKIVREYEEQFTFNRNDIIGFFGLEYYRDIWSSKEEMTKIGAVRFEENNTQKRTEIFMKFDKYFKVNQEIRKIIEKYSYSPFISIERKSDYIEEINNFENTKEILDKVFDAIEETIISNIKEYKEKLDNEWKENVKRYKKIGKIFSNIEE